MQQSYAFDAAQFFVRTLAAKLAGIEAIEITGIRENGWENECALIVEVEGAQRARSVFSRMAQHLGHPEQLSSQPQRGNTWLECRYLSCLSAEAVEAAPLWMCQVGSVPDWFRLPAVDHLCVEDVLQLRFATDLEESDERRSEIRVQAISVAEVLSEFDELEDLQLSGFGLNRPGGRISITALTNIGSLYQIKKFIDAALSRIPTLNVVAVHDFSSLCAPRSPGWDGNFALLLGCSINVHSVAV